MFYFRQFKTFMSTEYGNCYTIASPKYVAWRSGPAHGKKMMVVVRLLFVTFMFQIHFYTKYT